MSTTQINDIVKSSAEAAGIQRPLRPVDPDSEDEIKEWFLTTHRIRRSAISHWANDCDELQINQVRIIAGHADIEQTISYIEEDADAIAQNYQDAMRSNTG